MRSEIHLLEFRNLPRNLYSIKTILMRTCL